MLLLYVYIYVGSSGALRFNFLTICGPCNASQYLLSSKCDFPTPPSAFNACQNACACNVSEPVFDVLANFLLTRID